MILGH